MTGRSSTNAVTARPSGWLDGIAVSASALCLVHCLALPLIVAALPAFGLLQGRDDTTHWLLLGFAVPTSAWALSRGRKAAGLVPVAVGAAGLASMAAAVAFFGGNAAERWLTVAGVLLVATAHILNWRAAHRHP